MSQREVYQVRVHLIEARQLRGRDSSNRYSVSPIARVKLLAGLHPREQFSTRYDKRSAVYIDKWMFFDDVQLNRKEFDEAKLEVTLIDDHTVFSSVEIGSVVFDIPKVYEADYHEIFGKWCGLLSDDTGVQLQGFVRLSVIVLKQGDEPKVHIPAELESEDASIFTGMPDVDQQANVLTVRIIRVEINPCGLSIPRPEAYLVLRFGNQELKTNRAIASYDPVIPSGMELPIYTPTLSDSIRIEVVDANSGDAVVAVAKLSLEELAADPLDLQWVNMYGPRPLPATNVTARIFTSDEANFLDESNYRGRLLMYAAVDPTDDVAPKEKVTHLMHGAIKDMEGMVSGEFIENYTLRADLFEGVGIDAGILDSVYVTLAWGRTEVKSTPRKPMQGTIRFESGVDDGYYEQMDEIVARGMPTYVEQQYDIFLHVYVAAPLGDRRIAYRRIKPSELAEPKWREGPQWLMLRADPLARSEMMVAGAMLQVGLRLGTEAEMKTTKRPLVRVPKLKPYELRANIYQAQGLQPADANGLADPYVRVSLAGAAETSAIVDKSLNPMWNQQIVFPVLLPSDLSLAPKVLVTIFDSDTLLLIGPRGITDPPIAAAFAPVGAGQTVREFAKRELYRPGDRELAKPPEPFWLDLYDPHPDKGVDLGMLDDDAARRDLPKVGRLLCSFELIPVQDVKKEKAEGKALSIRKGVGSLQSTLPPPIPCRIELAIVGVRDLQRRRAGLATHKVSAPYVEFEYGDRSRGRTSERTAAAPTRATQLVHMRGPDANILETKYLHLELPAQHIFEPMLDVRVREGSKIFGALGGFDPIIGVCSINLGQLWARHRDLIRKDREEQERLEKAAREKARIREEEERIAHDKALEAGRSRPPKPGFTNQEIVHTARLRSLAHESRTSRAAQLRRAGRTSEEKGTRTRAHPEAVDLADSSEEEEEGEDQEQELQHELEQELAVEEDDGGDLERAPEPRMYDLMVGAESHLVSGTGAGSRHRSGAVKMAVRVIEESEFDEVMKRAEPLKLRQQYAERLYSVRVHVYRAHGLPPRADATPVEPFLKVYNGMDAHHSRSTRDRPIGATPEPDFYSSFELSAILPGESMLHVEARDLGCDLGCDLTARLHAAPSAQVWDYSIFGDRMVGATTIDLEHRWYSRRWRRMNAYDEIKKETRTLMNPTSRLEQGTIVLKVEILERRAAVSHPMIELIPPVREAYELRVVVWDAKDIVPTDTATGTADVRVSLQPRGSSGDYEKQSTDVHMFSSGDAQFNWRMVWPVFLPEKTPRLFVQSWDVDFLSADDAIGEAQLNMTRLFEKARRRREKTSIDRLRVECTHPNFPGQVMSTVIISIDVLPRTEALSFPVGKGRDPPNQFPYLETPVRPSFFDALGINLDVFNPFTNLRRKLIILAVCVVLLLIIGIVVYFALQKM